MDRFHRTGVAFDSVTQNFSTADAMGRLTLNMLMSFAEFEREMIAERTRDKIGAARRKGKWTGGVVPLGYDVVDRRLVVNQEEARRVREIFQRYLEMNSAVTVAQWLNDEGVPLKGQRRARPRPWAKKLVLRLLRDRLYIGLIHNRGEFFPGEHAAIVDQELFDQVQARLNPKVRTSHPVCRNPTYLVRGTLRCGACGSVMTTASSTLKGKVYRYYRCVTRGKQGSTVCTTRQLPAEAIELFVVEQLREALHQGLLSPEKAQYRLAEVEASRLEKAAKKNALA
jgi:site-specific DNA recombinase